MAVTPSSFRQQFTAFASSSVYPDGMINAWLAIGVQFVNADRWGELTDFGVSLWLAHNLVIQKRMNDQAAAGMTPGSNPGIVVSKTVDGASISYDVSAVTEQGAGHWNSTSFGTQFYRYMRMFGAGGIQIGAPGFGTSGPGLLSAGYGGYGWFGGLPPI